MAEVFEAELAGELGFVRKVAIKRMLAEAAADPEMAARFLDEARIASRLHHANVVSVLDMGLLDGLPFQVLELVEGINVQQLQGRTGGVLPLEVALIIASDVAHALDHAHNARDAAGIPLGIVHRDVKPSNFMVSWAGDVKLTDFGIAFANDRAVKTEAGFVPGTMGFIAPEQRMKGAVDGRTDVFALGLSLHAMLAGYTPLRDVAVEMDALSGKPIPVDTMLHADVRSIIERAITPDRRDRLTASQLADELGGLLAKRLSRDPRGYLRTFLAPLHDNQPKPGMLDQLLGFDVVPAGEPEGDRSRGYAEYALRETAVARGGAPAAALRTEAATTMDTPAGRKTVTEPGPGSSHAATGTPDAARAASIPPTRSRRARLAVAAVATLGLGGVATWQLTRTRERPPVAAGTGDAGTTIAQGADTMPAVDAGAVATAQPDAAMVAIAGPTDANVPAPPRTRHTTRLTRPPAEAGSAVAAARPVTGSGFLQVTGEANIGAKILVDGKDVGYAPNKLEVDRGHHAITIVRKNGETVSGQIDVTEYHTVTHPLRPSL